MPVQSIIRPYRWINEDGTPSNEFYKMLAQLPGINIPAPSVTGSRASGAALASLLTVLDSIGIITNNSTA